MTDAEFEHRVQVVGYGPYLWQVCEKCNYALHTCHFCGDDITHAQEGMVNQQNPCYVDVD